MVCLADGTLLLHSRATPHRLIAHSTDGGHSYTPAQPDPGLPDPSDNGSVTRFDGLPNIACRATPDTDNWLLATHNHDPSLRRNTLLKLSQDNGATWPCAVVLCAGSSAYSTAARLPDGRIGVLYERQGYQEIVFASVDPAELLASPTASLKYDGGTVTANGVVLDVGLRSITPGRPARWQSVGESFVLAQTNGDWDPSAWKEVGQGYSSEAPQVLSNRESQDLNYGQIIPGYKVGDVLAFAGRVANSGPDPMHVSVITTGPRDADVVVADRVKLLSGANSTFTTTYQVSAQDVAAGTLTLTFQAKISPGVNLFSVQRGFVFNMMSGFITEFSTAGV